MILRSSLVRAIHKVLGDDYLERVEEGKESTGEGRESSSSSSSSSSKSSDKKESTTVEVGVLAPFKDKSKKKGDDGYDLAWLLTIGEDVKQFSDLTFRVGRPGSETKDFFVIKAIFCARSEMCRTMFYKDPNSVSGFWIETDRERIKDKVFTLDFCSVEAFEILLRWMYTFKVFLFLGLSLDLLISLPHSDLLEGRETV